MLVVLSDYFVDNLTILSFVPDLLSLPCNLVTNSNFLLSLVNHHVSILYLLSELWHSYLTSVRLLCHFLDLKVSNIWVVKFIPFASPSILYNWVIMSTISMTDMYNKSFQNIFVVCAVKLFFLFDCFWALLLS